MTAANQQDEQSSAGINKIDGIILTTTNGHAMQDSSSSLMAYVPRFRYDDNHPPEATGLAMDVFARAFIIMAGVFLGPALLECASKAVETQCLSRTFDSEEGLEECIQMGRVHGFRPSSLLSNIAIASGFLGSVLMPLVGACVDHTPFRLHVGACSALGLVFVKGAETIISPKTWFVCAWFQVLSSIFYNIHVTTTLAYTSDLSDEPAKQSSYNTYFGVVMYFSTILFLAFVSIMSGLLTPGDDIGTARISQITTTLGSVVVFFYCWKYFFRNKPALSSIPEGQNIVSVGFYKVLDTRERVTRELPGLKWFLISIMFAESASMTLATIGTTFMKEHLKMGADEISVVFGCVLIMGAPGSKLGGWLALRINSLNGAIVCNIIFIFSTAIAAVALTGPEHKTYMNLIGSLWGLAIGFQAPIHATLLISIFPRGSEAEFMGLYILASQILSWLPPLLFTMINEAGLSMNYGLASVDVFFLLGIGALFMMGDYDSVVNHGRVAYSIQPQEEEEEETDIQLDKEKLHHQNGLGNFEDSINALHHRHAPLSEREIRVIN